MSILNDLKYRFKKAKTLEQLIYINIAIFAFTLIVDSFSGLYKSQNNFVFEWFSLTPDLQSFIVKPWTLVTYGFLHADFIHIIFNLIWFYYFGRLFVEYFTQKQLLNFYVLGTVFGGILFMLSYNYFPLFEGQIVPLVGASAGISAIVIGIATYIPNYQLKIPLIGFVKLWHLAVVFVLLDLIKIDGNNAGGHIAHIGGALFGFLYVSRASNKELNLFGSLSSLFKKKKSPLKTVHKSKKSTRTSTQDKNNNQQKIDTILDKISKSGYDTLSKEEKEFLFKQGKS